MAKSKQEQAIFDGNPADLKASSALRILANSALGEVNKEPLVTLKDGELVFPRNDNKGSALQASLDLTASLRNSLSKK